MALQRSYSPTIRPVLSSRSESSLRRLAWVPDLTARDGPRMARRSV